jgi:N-formylglutamate amidohydrolase
LRDQASDREIPAPFEVRTPAEQSSAVVYASPHSGDYYPPRFVAESVLDPLTLRKSEDSYVDELFGAAPAHGSPLLAVRYARVYLDVNREPYELDPAMFMEPLPDGANTTSLRVAGGLGTIARVVADGAEVYRRKLPVAEIDRRLESIYRPYHETLGELLTRTRDRFGRAVVIDCHSMPSIGGPMDGDGGQRRPDIVLGDRFGTSCSSRLIDLAQSVLSGLGYVVGRNAPYAGGFTTQHYGRPHQGLEALQIEINRALYMDERSMRKLAGFTLMQRHMTTLIARLADYVARPALAAE